MICKDEDHRTSNHASFVESQKPKVNYKAQPHQYASSFKQVSKPKVKPLPPCTYCGFNDHRPDDCQRDEGDVLLDDNEMIEVKVHMALADDENVVVGKESARNRGMGEDHYEKGPWLSEVEGFTLPNHDTDRILQAGLQVKITDSTVAITNSSTTEYDLGDESSICSIPLLPMRKLAGDEPIYGPKTIKSILKSNSTFKPKTWVTINKPTSAPAKGNKNVLASKRNSAPIGKLKNVKIKDGIPLSIYLKSQGGSSSRSKTSRPSKPFLPYIQCGFNYTLSDDCVNYPIRDICGSYDHDAHSYNMVIYLRRGIKPSNPQLVKKSYETCGSTVHTTTDHNEIECFRRGKALQTKKAEAFQSHKIKLSNANRSKTPIKGYSDSDYAGCNMDKKITSGDYKLLGGKLIYDEAYVVLSHFLKHWEAFTRTPNQYKEYMLEFCYTAKALKNSEIIVEIALGKSDPNDSVSKQQEKTKSASKGLKTFIAKPATRKGESSIEKETKYVKEEFNTSLDLSNSDDAKKEIKLEDLSKMMQNVDVDFMDLDSLEDDQPIILIKLLVNSLKPELSKLLSSHDFSKSLPTMLKELPFKFNDLTREIKELKKHVHELEINLPGDLKEILTKLDKCSSTVSNLTTHVTELRTQKWKLLANILSIPGQVSSVQAKIKTLDALPSLLSKVTKASNRFAQAVKQASHKAGGQSVPSAGQAGTHLAEGEKNIKQAKLT
nr:retrovirus-related Pol polyprotein from transposon TNT 1-94 [Tanacetum cinerariifolium]